MYSDVEIEVNGESLKAHKCILTARSEKFRAMLLSEAVSEMVEQRTNKVQINNKALTLETFKQMLKWLYMGECAVSQDPNEVIPLL